jgi:hypothetical protein
MPVIEAGLQARPNFENVSHRTSTECGGKLQQDYPDFSDSSGLVKSALRKCWPRMQASDLSLVTEKLDKNYIDMAVVY